MAATGGGIGEGQNGDAGHGERVVRVDPEGQAIAVLRQPLGVDTGADTDTGVPTTDTEPTIPEYFPVSDIHVQARFGYDALTQQIADDGDTALAFLQSNPVDLVITDLEMPKVDGYGLIQPLP